MQIEIYEHFSRARSSVLTSQSVGDVGLSLGTSDTIFCIMAADASRPSMCPSAISNTPSSVV